MGDNGHHNDDDKSINGDTHDELFEELPSSEGDAEEHISIPISVPITEHGVEKNLKKLWLKGFYWLAVVGVWLSIVLGFVVFYLAIDLPDIDALPPPGQNDRVEIRANDGSLLVTYGAVLDRDLTKDEIPDIMKMAIVAIEDKRFFEHSGFDGRSFLRALWANISFGGVRQGGSTISQQLAKNIFLSRERTVKRKVQELLLAFWLEQKFGKEAILTLYLNRVYFGSGTYGIEAASQKFFGHSAKTLNIGEAALLAGLVKAPSRLTPLRNKEAAYNRSFVVLGAMAASGFIDQQQLQFGHENPPPISAKQIGGEDRYFTDWVLDKLPQLVANQHQQMVVYTSLDPNVQAAAVQALQDGLAGGVGADAKIGQGAILALSFDGSVQAMVGGSSYAESQFNRTTQSLRQPGSAFKPFIYLAAIEGGLSMDIILNDAPLNIDGWEPNNFSGEFLGEMPIKEAFARSINTIAVQVSEWAGRDNVVAVAKRLGLTSKIHNHPSIALGTPEVKMLDMVAAYSSFANGGLSVAPYGVLEIRSTSGALLYRREQVEQARVISEDNLSNLQPLLEGVITSGTGRAASSYYPVAGKSGTSQNYRDAWFVGYTDRLTAAVWLGNDDGSAMVNVTGGGLPARIWHQFMDAERDLN